MAKKTNLDEIIETLGELGFTETTEEELEMFAKSKQETIELGYSVESLSKLKEGINKISEETKKTINKIFSEGIKNFETEIIPEMVKNIFKMFNKYVMELVNYLSEKYDIEFLESVKEFSKQYEWNLN